MTEKAPEPKKKLDFEDESVIYAIDRPLLLEASAGSGKTTVLVERYLASILFRYFVEKKSHYESVRSVVAVTFTRKAASEMKDRIRSRIRDQFTPEYLGRIISRLEKHNGVVIPDRAEATGRLLDTSDDLLQAVLSAPISTIHSFALSYLRSYPVESGIDPFAVTQDETGIEELSITSADALTASMREMIRGRNRDLAWMIKVQGYELVREMIKELDRAVNGAGIPLLEEALRKEGYLDYENAQDPAAQLCKTLLPLLESLNGIYGGLLEKVPARSRPPVKRAMDKIARFIGKNSPEDIFRDDLWYDGTLTEVTDEVSPLYGKISREKIRVFFPFLWRVYLVYWTTSEKLKEHRKEISFSDIEIKFLEMLRSNRAIRAKIAGDIRYLLVDEYQDTSDLQKEIFDLLLKESGHGAQKKNEGIVPFMVGDPKQSIFGFRNANLEVFYETRKEMGTDGYKRLNRNYRSTPELVKDINEIFRTVFRESGPRIEYLDQEAASLGRAGGGAVFYPAGREEGGKVFDFSVRQASRHIRRLVVEKGYSPGEIMVLLRKKTNMSVLKEAFEENLTPAGIKYYIVEDIADLMENREIRNLVIYLRALENRESDHYFLALLKSPFFRKSDPEILALKRLPGPGLYEAANRAVSAEMAIFNGLYRVKNRLIIPELAEEIVTRTGYFAYLNTLPGRKEATTNLIVFLDFLRKIQDVEMFSLTDFLYYLQEYKVSPRPPQVVGEKSDVVRVMTVHMAKGLQSRAVVYIAPYQKSDTEKIRLLVRKREGSYGVFLNLFERISRRKSESMKEYLADMQREEEKRLAYVALTRAEEQFSYFGIIPEASHGIEAKNDFWNAFIRMDEPCFSKRTLAHDGIGADGGVHYSGGEPGADRQAVLAKLGYLKEREKEFAYGRYPRILTVTQLLDIEFIGEGFRNRYITRSFPVEEALNEIADLSDILHESNPNADIGTYLHRVFQVCGADDYREFIGKTIERENETIRSNRDKILSLTDKFYQSAFYRDQHMDDRSICREFEINYNSVFGADTVLIKGSIDLYIRRKNRGVLIDYKLTVPEDRSRYERQLNYYAHILGELGYPVVEMYLYDIMQNREVRVEKAKEDIGAVLTANIGKIAELYQSETRS